ncbi:hypothetical protein BpHYR1_022016 [Brachionus plicatilis]|uniref:Uncharacterized protein n=1 Tax=Brachionus plicatilis TaxID=10195 RepID=A0A3M7PMB2_BRAPC|nr:hypothetical protein BpHYR1_022016 [Brachionus plicatilis]
MMLLSEESNQKKLIKYKFFSWNNVPIIYKIIFLNIHLNNSNFSSSLKLIGSVSCCNLHNQF